MDFPALVGAEKIKFSVQIKESLSAIILGCELTI